MEQVTKKQLIKYLQIVYDIDIFAMKAIMTTMAVLIIIYVLSNIL